MADETQNPAEKPRFLDNPRNVRASLWGFYALCAAAVVFELLRPLGLADTDLHAPERAPALAFVGAFALYGFVSCVTLVLLGRGLRRLMGRPEDFYPRSGPLGGPTGGSLNGDPLGRDKGRSASGGEEK